MCFLQQLPEVTVLLHTHQVTGIVVRLEFKTTTEAYEKKRINNHTLLNIVAFQSFGYFFDRPEL
jgi:hypothetical protein